MGFAERCVPQFPFAVLDAIPPHPPPHQAGTTEPQRDESRGGLRGTDGPRFSIEEGFEATCAPISATLGISGTEKAPSPLWDTLLTPG